ncbi:hypothetical protein ACLOJK_034285, partial [Asimina triloba]
MANSSSNHDRCQPPPMRSATSSGHDPRAAIQWPVNGPITHRPEPPVRLIRAETVRHQRPIRLDGRNPDPNLANEATCMPRPVINGLQHPDLVNVCLVFTAHREQQLPTTSIQLSLISMGSIVRNCTPINTCQ